MADTSKLSTFLDSNKLNPKRLIAVSHDLETLRREDRDIKLKKRQAKGGEAPAEGEKKDLGKPRSGRPVTTRALDTALKGGAVSGPTKQRILRAVNYLLEQKKKDKVDLRQLF
ncbi:MAG: hypothetical protein JST00_33545 [Deltaproteobacteria bacterium]|nr:hypothetical protein [Deltaproteobacteria bacterium]